MYTYEIIIMGYALKIYMRSSHSSVFLVKSTLMYFSSILNII